MNNSQISNDQSSILNDTSNFIKQPHSNSKRSMINIPNSSSRLLKNEALVNNVILVLIVMTFFIIENQLQKR